MCFVLLSILLRQICSSAADARKSCLPLNSVAGSAIAPWSSAPNPLSDSLPRRYRRLFFNAHLCLHQKSRVCLAIDTLSASGLVLNALCAIDNAGKSVPTSDNASDRQLRQLATPGGFCTGRLQESDLQTRSDSQKFHNGKQPPATADICGTCVRLRTVQAQIPA